MELSKLQKEYGHSLNLSVTIAMAIWNSSWNPSFLKDENPQYEGNIRISIRQTATEIYRFYNFKL